jgi:hypothetical protein
MRDRLHGVLYLVETPLGREDGRARVVAARHGATRTTTRASRACARRIGAGHRSARA